MPPKSSSTIKPIIKKKTLLINPEKDESVKVDDAVMVESVDVPIVKEDLKEDVKKQALKITKKKVSITSEASEIKNKDTKDVKDPKDQEVLIYVSKAIKTTKKLSKKQDQQDIFDEDDVDYRFVMLNYDFSKNKTLPRITKYEKALLVGKRAKQIEDGANPNVKVLPGQNAIEIAEEELRQRKIPFIIKRPIGNKFEYWRPADMEVIMD
jgi:DNA-directed RNA polymerase I, II, and III subunit RPABC2